MAIIRTADKTFQPGVTYATRSICDHECIYRFKIVRRTAKSVWVEIRGTVERRAISVSKVDGVEQFKPFGSYSMAAIISADQRAA